MVELVGFFLVNLFVSSFGNGVVPLGGKGNTFFCPNNERLNSIQNEIFLLSDCGGYYFVDNEVVIDGPFNEGCILQFQTQEDRILAFTVVDGDMKEALSSISVNILRPIIANCACGIT
jgi:hypothetical protein